MQSLSITEEIANRHIAGEICVNQEVLKYEPLKIPDELNSPSLNKCVKDETAPATVPIRRWTGRGKYSNNNSPEDPEKKNIFAAIPRQNKKHKAVSRGEYENSRMCMVHELNMSENCIKNIARAGILFYTLINKDLYICFGRDNRTGDLTDFGGHKQHGETPIACAVREANEETRHVFGELKVDQTMNCRCLYNSNMLIIFVPVIAPDDNTNIIKSTMETFASKKYLAPGQHKNRCYNEISGLEWLHENLVKNIFSPYPQIQMFAKVKRFICSCVDFNHDINRMKLLLTESLLTNPSVEIKDAQDSHDFKLVSETNTNTNDNVIRNTQLTSTDS